MKIILIFFVLVSTPSLVNCGALPFRYSKIHCKEYNYHGQTICITNIANEEVGFYVSQGSAKCGTSPSSIFIQKYVLRPNKEACVNMSEVGAEYCSSLWISNCVINQINDHCANAVSVSPTNSCVVKTKPDS